MSESKCSSIEGCSRPSSSRGWCSIHYERWRRGAGANASIRPYGTKGICSADGCEKPATHKSWCLLHYARWRKHGDPLIARLKRGTAELEAFRAQTKQCARCAKDFSPTSSETEETWAKRRFCSRACSRTSPLGSYAIDVIHVKVCEVCGALIQRAPGGSWAQWAAKCTCSRACRRKLTRLNRRGIAYPLHWTPYQVRAAWGQRQKMPGWAAWWEEQRRAEDLAEFAATVRGGPACRINQAPRRRYFISGTCPDCNEMVTVVRHRWCGSIRCPPCTRARWRETHYERAARYGLRFDVIAPIRVFERDGWRCQICQRKTKGKWPAPRSPTVDHIVPMARGGHHVLENLQCACLACNVSKGARSANDQLRLAV